VTTVGADTQITDLTVNDHACLTFGEPEELLDLTAAFLRDGLSCAWPVLLRARPTKPLPSIPRSYPEQQKLLQIPRVTAGIRQLCQESRKQKGRQPIRFTSVAKAVPGNQPSRDDCVYSLLLSRWAGRAPSVPCVALPQAWNRFPGAACGRGRRVPSGTSLALRPAGRPGGCRQ
jgi:hypothetical protein